MALDPAVLDALLAAGATAEMIVAAVKADAAKDEARKAARRANNAERQRRYKARHREEVTDNDAGNALPRVSNVTPSPSLSSPQTPQQTHPHPDNKPRTRKGASIPAKPDEVSEQVWRDFLIHRKEKDAPVTETVIDGYRAEAAKAGVSLQTAMATSITQGWQGFRASWLKDEDRTKACAPAGGDTLVASILARKAREASG